MRLFRALGRWGALGVLAVAGAGYSQPAPRPASPPAAGSPAGPVRKLPRLALTTYYYSFQADPRKAAPGRPVRRQDGSSLLVTHPWDGVGPWFSYDQVQWHKNQLAVLRDTGIDIVLPVFAGGDTAAGSYRIKGLACLAQALKEIRAEGKQPLRRERGFPLVGMWLDLSAVREIAGAPPDLKTENGRRALYSAIRTFFRHIPPEFRAGVQVPPDARRSAGARGGADSAPPEACIVVMTGLAAVSAWDDGAVAYCSRRFAQDFGRGLLWIGGADLQGKARGLDGYLATATTPEQSAVKTEGWLKVASVGPVERRSDVPGAAAPVLDRKGGQTLIQSFLGALRSSPDWIVVDSWNQFERGTEVSPSHEYGLQPRDLTDAGVTQFKGTGDFGAIILHATVPEAILSRTLYQVEVLVENTGLAAWGVQNRAGLSYRWYRDGKPVGDPGPLIAAPNLTPGEAKVFQLGLVAPMQGTRPLPEDRYELRLDMMVPPDQWFAGSDSAPYIVRVEVGKAPAWRPTFLGSDLPTLLKAGASYSATMRVRNDGSETWQKAQGVTLGYRWRRVVPSRGGAAPESDEPVSAAMVSVPLPADVPPGAAIPVPITVRVAGAQGAPLPVWSPRDGWSYDLEWGFFDGQNWLSGSDAPGYREGVAVLDADVGAAFLGTGIGTHLEGGRTIVTNVGVQNRGPETWRLANTKLVYRWYYFDGTEVAPSAGSAPLPRDILPGETIILREVAVAVPEYNGPMYLVFDLQVGDDYASASANTRGAGMLVLSTLVTGGRFLPLDLAPVFDTDGISVDTNRADGDLDGKGSTLPSELLPPYILRPPEEMLPAASTRPNVGAAPLQTNLYPCGLWSRPVGTRSTPQGPVTDTVTFRFPDKRERTMNAVSCAGQRIQFPAVPGTAIHLLGCATAADAAGSLTVVYNDGTTSQHPLTMSLWTAPPAHGEHVAFTCGHRHTAQGDETTGRAYLNHYTVRLEGAKPIAALVLPQNRAMKVFAITVEALVSRSPTIELNPRFRLPPNLQPK